MNPASDPEADEVFRFTARFYEDLDAGTERSLDRYLELFPAFPELIRQTFAELTTPSVLAETSADSPSTDADDVRIGPYRVLRELGRGGQGIVHLAEDQRLQRRVALKVLRGVGTESAAMRARLAREAEATSKLDDPGICTVFEVGDADGIPFIAMRFIDGVSLAHRLVQARAGAGIDRQEPRADPSDVFRSRQP